MIFQVRTDNHIRNGEAFAESIRADVEAALVPRYGDRLRRVEVYLEDTNSVKDGNTDTQCSIEVHLAGPPAVAIEDKAGDVETAVDGAVEKMVRVLVLQRRFLLPLTPGAFGPAFSMALGRAAVAVPSPR